MEFKQHTSKFRIFKRIFCWFLGENLNSKKIYQILQLKRRWIWWIGHNFDESKFFNWIVGDTSLRSDFPQIQLQCAPRRKLSLMVVLSRIIGKVWKPKGSQNITSFQVKDTYFSQKSWWKIGFILLNNPGIRRFQEGKPPEKEVDHQI